MGCCARAADGGFRRKRQSGRRFVIVIGALLGTVLPSGTEMQGRGAEHGRVCPAPVLGLRRSVKFPALRAMGEWEHASSGASAGRLVIGPWSLALGHFGLATGPIADRWRGDRLGITLSLQLSWRGIRAAGAPCSAC